MHPIPRTNKIENENFPVTKDISSIEESPYEEESKAGDLAGVDKNAIESKIKKIKKGLLKSFPYHQRRDRMDH